MCIGKPLSEEDHVALFTTKINLFTVVLSSVGKYLFKFVVFEKLHVGYLQENYK